MQVIQSLNAEANKLGIPFILVLFPDRVSVDQDLRSQLQLGEEQLVPLRQLSKLVYQAVPGVPVLDVANALRGRTGMYRFGDTHLSDLGNTLVGSYVGKEMVKLLAPSRIEGP